MKPQTLYDQLFFTTVHITDNNDGMGTGFFYSVPVEGGEATFLVTNKHVIEDAQTITLRFIAKNSAGEPDLSKAYPITISDFGFESWTGHPDPQIDVAVIPISGLLQHAIDSGMTPFFVSLSPAIVPTEQQISELDSVMDVSFVGYPDGIYDHTNSLPIIRRGTTASLLQVDYEGKPTFLIDASVFPGSSGSPVLIIQNGMRTMRDGSVSLGGSVAYLVGIVAAMKLRTVVGQLVDTNTKVVSVSGEGIDLGIVYKARTIDECVDAVLAKVKLKRSHISVPEISPNDGPTQIDEKIADAHV